MLIYPEINPVAIAIGPIKIHWYGIMYLLGFLGGWTLATYRSKRANSGWHKTQIDDLLFYIVLGIILGGRIGYMLFYHPTILLENPLKLLMIWQGGMSFHGGLIGVLIAMALYAKKINKTFFMVTDFIAPFVPIGLFTGRIGNFINGELWGHPTDLPWAMVFPHVDNLPRHPSQLYEALLEGLVLFIILWIYSRKPRPRMAVSGLFLLGYGCFRFAVEWARQPDSHLGYLAFNWLTMGQALSLPMIVIGIILLGLAYIRKQ